MMVAGIDDAIVTILVDIATAGIAAYDKLDEQNKQRVRDLYASTHAGVGKDVVDFLQLSSDLKTERDSAVAELAAAKASHQDQIAARDQRIAALEAELATLKAPQQQQ